MALKVFDLQCGQGHVFEGWFSAEKSFEEQAAQGLLSCPMCADTAIERKLSAPRLQLSRGPEPAPQPQAGQARVGDASAAAPSGQLARLQAEMLRHMRAVVKNSENVGARFAEEALKIHHGDARDRMIRGTATPEEQRELAEEGVAVMPVPDFLDDDQMQ